MHELNVRVAKYENMVCVEEAGNERGYTSESDAKSRSLQIAKLSGTDFRNVKEFSSARGGVGKRCLLFLTELPPESGCLAID